MKRIIVVALLGAVWFVVAAAVAWQVQASADSVKFPDNFADGVLYTTVTRGNLKEEIWTSRATIDAVKAGHAIPSGTVITLVDFRDGKLFRYVVMEKRAGWGGQYPPDRRNGEWEYQAFNADRTVNTAENLDRCFACHKPRAAQDFVHTFEQMKTAN